MPSHAEGLGNVFGAPVTVASGVHIPFNDAEAITFFVYAAAGDQGVTLKESIAGASEQNLAVIDKLWKVPRSGGTGTEITQTAAATYTLSDATNDLLIFTVAANELSDTFDSVEVTTTGTSPVTWAMAHGLKVKRDPANLASNI